MCASKILFELSGSIAAWKACAVISRLAQEGHEVQTVVTESALKFIGAATLEGLTGRAPKSDLWERGAAMEHINLVKWADVVVLCPATANTINSLAAGIAGDLVGSLFLAHDWRKPFLLAPAMNPAMWSHPATKASIERLRGFGVTILPVAQGRLACGDVGEGRLIEPDEILGHIRAALPGAAKTGSNATQRRRVLITAGGTEEPIDGVRTISNFSTGATGALIADVLAEAGHEVTLLRAKRGAMAGDRVRAEGFSSFSDLEAALRRHLGDESFDVVVHAAAVSDYSVAGLVVNGVEQSPGAGKVGSGQDVSIRLAPNPKLVDRLREWSCNPHVRIVAFKLTRDADPAAQLEAVDALFVHSDADMVVHNDLSEAGCGSGDFPATLWRPHRVADRVGTRAGLAAALESFVRECGGPRPAPNQIPAAPAANR